VIGNLAVGAMDDLLAANSSLEEDRTAISPGQLYTRPTTVFAAVAASLFTVVGVIGRILFQLCRPNSLKGHS